jgi:hypothetical protein
MDQHELMNQAEKEPIAVILGLWPQEHPRMGDIQPWQKAD